MKEKSWLLGAFFLPAVLLYFELALRIFAGQSSFGLGLVLICLFSLSLGLLTEAVLGSFPGRWHLWLVRLFVILCALYFGAQFFYYHIFSNYFTLYSMLHGGEAFQFADTILSALKAGWYVFPILLVPVFLSFFNRDKNLRTRILWKRRGLLALGALILYLLALGIILLDHEGGLSARTLYFESGDAANRVERFGAMTSLRLDLRDTLLPSRESDGSVWEFQGHKSKHSFSDSIFKKQVLDLDFDQLIESAPNDTIAKLHQYFSQVEPTTENAYTGKYKGYNLIEITAEGFSPYAVDEEITPTLYKLVHEGYYFTHFYNPIWGVSTSDGEYTLCTGLVPKAGVWSFKESSNIDLPFTLGNQFRALGITPRAYHDHTYSYYDRNLSHPNAGYYYQGLGNGLDVTQVWPESDLEMMENSVDEYIGEPLFHTYYMTVSGHMNYTFYGNTQAAKHQEEVAGLSYSDHCKAYIACNIEFDLAMEYLLERLTDAGIIDHTLIVFSNDHYPYGLSDEEQLELAGVSSFNPAYERYHSNLVIWSGDMQGDSGQVIDKICSQVDILPTVSNLLGLPYDSRMLSGTDIFSDSEGMLMLKDTGWVTQQGYYDASTGEFTPAEGYEEDSAYVAATSRLVENRFRAAASILDNNYYRTIETQEIKDLMDHPIPLP